MKILGASLDLINKKVINLADPTAATDAVNKQYLDGVVRGLDWKQEVLAASTTQVSLTAPGTTLDGYTLVANDRVLLKDQTLPVENGIYVWTAGGATMTRALDANTGPSLSGSTVTVQRGTINADRIYRVTADDPLIIGTTPVTMAQIGAGGLTYVGGNGLVLTGSTFDVVPLASGGIVVAADSISVDTAIVVRKFAVNIGDGAAVTFVKAHGLGTADLTFAVREVSSGEIVFPDVVIDATNVTLTFATIPASNQYRLSAQG